MIDLKNRLRSVIKHYRENKVKSLIILTMAALLLIFFAISSGTYNFAATEKHWKITEKLIAWARVSSVIAHSKNLEIPTIDEAETFKVGARHYNAMCIICHLAPGLEPSELSVGLYPQAPLFFKRAPVTEEEEKLKMIKEYFWVIKNGIKMTAMPAWGPTHDDEFVWAMAIFVHKLHGMTAEEYGEFAVTGHDHEHDDHQHNHNLLPLNGF